MKNIVYKNIVIDPSPELSAHITIAPLDFRCNESMSVTYDLLRDFEKGGYYAILEDKGRAAIAHCLKHLNIQKDDIVTILTTSGNYYISGCVTKEIEKYCKWNRQICSKTKVIFVNHEFGYPYKGLKELLSYNLPIIEDCAHSFFTTSYGIGTVGDFVIYSLPKAFNIQKGAMLVSKDKIEPTLPVETEEWIKSRVLPQYLRKQDIIAHRIANYRYLEQRLKHIGIMPFFTLEKGCVPGVFLFKWFAHIDYSSLKIFMNSNGVESSVFYGEHAFYIPCHNALSGMELDYICSLLEYYYNNVIISG